MGNIITEPAGGGGGSKHHNTTRNHAEGRQEEGIQTGSLNSPPNRSADCHISTRSFGLAQLNTPT